MEDRIVVDFNALDRIARQLKNAGSELSVAAGLLSGASLTRDAGAHFRINGSVHLKTVGVTVNAASVAQAVNEFRTGLNRVSAYSQHLGTNVSKVTAKCRDLERVLGTFSATGENAPKGNGSVSGAHSNVNAEAIGAEKSNRKIELRHFKGNGAVRGVARTTSKKIGNTTVSESASGELIGGSYDVSPFSAEMKGHLAKGTIASSVGILSGTFSTTVGSAKVKGLVGATLYDKNGRFTPNIFANAKAEVSALKGEAKVQIGADENNVHIKATGDLLTANAKAEIQAGVITAKESDTGKTRTTYGISAEAGAGAYLASGKVSGGITIFGIKIDGDVSGHAGGAGVKVGTAIVPSSVSGEIGAGLGLGLGIKITIDWSKFKFAW